MPRGNVRVNITADASGVVKGTRQAENALDRLSKTGHSSMGGLRTAAMGLSGVLLGAGGVVAGLKSVTDAAIESEKSQAKLEAQLKALGISYKAHAKQIDEVIQKTSKLAGLDDEDLQDAFTNIVRSTKSVSEGLKLVGTAADIARAKHMDVAAAGQLVGKVYNGNVGALKRLGIAFDPVTKAQDALKASTKKATDEQKEAAKQADKTASANKAIAALQRTFSGTAERYGKTTAGAMDRFRVASENLREKIGTALLPTVTKVASQLAKFVDQMTNGTGAGGRFAAKLKEIADRIVPIVKFFKDHPQLIAIAAGAWVTYRVAALTALAATRVKLIAQFLGLGPKAAVGGAEAGAGFGGGFNAAASRRIRAFGWSAVGVAIGAEMGSAVLSKLKDALGHGGHSFFNDLIPSNLLPDTNNFQGPLGKALGLNKPNKIATGKIKPIHIPTKSPTGTTRHHGGAVAHTSSIGGGGPVAHASSSGGFVAAGGTNFSQGDEPEIARRLAALGQALGTTIYGISGYRTPAHSVAVGGFANDPHTRGAAADIGVGSMSRASAGQLSEATLNKFGLTRPFAGAAEVNHIQLLGGHSGHSAGRKHKAKPITQLDRLTAGAARAALTGSLSDDIKNAQAQVRYWEGRYSRARRSGNARAIQAAAEGLRSARDGLAELRRRRTDARGAAKQRAADRASTAHDKALGALTDELGSIDQDLELGFINAPTAQAKRQAVINRARAARSAGQISERDFRGILQTTGAGADAILGTADDAGAGSSTVGGGTDLKDAIEALTAEMARQRTFSESVANITSREAVRVMADVISGQIVGFGVTPRAATAGSGQLARY